MLLGRLLGMSILLASTQSVAAPYTGPVLTKATYSGHTPVEWQSGSSCNIYLDRVEIELHFGRPLVAVKQVKAVQISANIQDLIAKAALEPFEEGATLCDAPGFETYSSIPSVLDPVSGSDRLRLEAFSTCSSDGRRKGPASTHLLRLVDRLCE